MNGLEQAVGIIPAAAFVLVLSMSTVRADAAKPASGIASPPPGLPGYKLVWSDEFNHDGLPDPTKWGYEEGFIRNHEAQYYTRARKENARVENGVLVIEGRKEQYKNPHFDPNSKPGAGLNESQEFASYTAASLVTRGKGSWQYGRIEMRAKLPQGKGMWPAFWTLGVNENKVGWPACGEIDIMEFVGKEPGQVHATVHYQKNGKHASSGHALDVTKPWEDFHTYAVEWTPDRMDFFYDGIKYHTFDVAAADENGENPFRKPHSILLNLAIGGEWGGPIDDAMLPQKYLVDYVRVYQKETAGAR